MPKIIDPETMSANELPGIWSPVQWDLSEDERIAELEAQAQASLLAAIDPPEAMLRLMLNELEIERAYEPPEGYDPEIQGEWDDTLVTFQFKRQVKLVTAEREPDYLYVEYDVDDLGRWAIEIEPEQVGITRM